MFPEDLFADWPEGFHPPTPSTPLPQRSFEEKLEQYPDDDFYRSLRESMAQVRAESQRKVEALGFSSWKEKESHDVEERRKWLKEYVKEHGHSPPPPVITEDQRIAAELQYQRSVKPKPVPCDCEEHLHPCFCPQKLLNYKSQGDDPSDFHFLQSLHPPELNVRIQESDTSNRIPDRWLEHVWGIPSQDRILRLPQWVKRDETVQRMIDIEEVDETIYHGDYDQNKNHPPPLRTVSLTPDFSAEENAEASRDFERHGEPNRHKNREESAAGRNPKQEPPRITTKVDNFHASLPIGPTTDLSESRSHLAAETTTQRSRRGRGRNTSAPGVNKTKRASRAQACGIKKRPASMKEAAGKATLSGRMRTRAQGVLSFLALDSSGRATTISGD